MKRIDAHIRPYALDAVRAALVEADIGDYPRSKSEASVARRNTASCSEAVSTNRTLFRKQS